VQLSDRHQLGLISKSYIFIPILKNKTPMRILFLCLFLTIYAAILQGQEKFTSLERQAFASVFLSEKLAPKNESPLDSLLLTFQVSKSRYAEIFRSYQNQERASFSQNEIQLLKAIEVENDELERKKEKRILKACKESDLRYETYQAILNEYRKHISFQRSMKPFFDDIIKQLK
jgi:hypothetical protein